mmetsp:Transcript_102640/g.188217  ORF Transcript_102640/g.188217 Transcript_102640/m.188217 type:complete len:97 (-) Transcript_102640:93-383(-)
MAQRLALCPRTWQRKSVWTAGCDSTAARPATRAAKLRHRRRLRSDLCDDVEKELTTECYATMETSQNILEMCLEACKVAFSVLECLDVKLSMSSCG